MITLLLTEERSSGHFGNVQRWMHSWRGTTCLFTVSMECWVQICCLWVLFDSSGNCWRKRTSSFGWSEHQFALHWTMLSNKQVHPRIMHMWYTILFPWMPSTSLEPLPQNPMHSWTIKCDYTKSISWKVVQLLENNSLSSWNGQHNAFGKDSCLNKAIF